MNTFTPQATIAEAFHDNTALASLIEALESNDAPTRLDQSPWYSIASAIPLSPARQLKLIHTEMADLSARCVIVLSGEFRVECNIDYTPTTKRLECITWLARYDYDTPADDDEPDAEWDVVRSVDEQQISADATLADVAQVLREGFVKMAYAALTLANTALFPEGEPSPELREKLLAQLDQ